MTTPKTEREQLLRRLADLFADETHGNYSGETLYNRVSYSKINSLLDSALATASRGSANEVIEKIRKEATRFHDEGTDEIDEEIANALRYFADSLSTQYGHKEKGK